jgi:hypothetical protein
MFIDFDEEWFALGFMWVALLAVVIGYLTRIALLLREQQMSERMYRLHLARRRAAELRSPDIGR